MLLRKVKENKRLEIIQKINTFIAFCCVENKEISEKLQKNIENINNFIKETNENLEIYIEKKKDYCFINIYFVDKITQEELARFKLPNIF